MKSLQHLAIIMDGNGRWAQSKRLPRSFGHIKGARVARKVIEWCVDLKIPNLTLYAFSSENWLRPQNEISVLMHLLSKHLRRQREQFHKKNIKFQVIGDINRLPAEAREQAMRTIELTKTNTGMVLTFALSYGGRQEIVNAAREIARNFVHGGLDPELLNETTFSHYLQTAGQVDPDLLIRTSGESRISNFLLWQLAYTEIKIIDTNWPDFSKNLLVDCINWYQERERRFGKVTSSDTKALTTNLEDKSAHPS